ncbi:MAG: DUF4190 domain-containing protein [Acidimicrobiales bacterium]
MNDTSQMSDTSQGPGWWLASDGKWYPPSVPPGPLPSPVSPVGNAPTSTPQVRSVARTNGFAVASLVLGLLWVLGLGSILALIFGIVAQKQIRASSGAEGGKGLAKAGTVLGAVGIACLMLIIGLAINSARQTGTIVIGGQTMSVRIASFADPAGDSNQSYCSGTSTGSTCTSADNHYAKVQFAITNSGDSAVSSTMHLGAVGYDSAGNSYTSSEDQNSSGYICAQNTNDAPSSLAPGQTLDYCIPFVLNNSTTLTKVELAPTGDYDGGSHTFSVNDTFSGWSS